jgi:hypothetical protein
MDAISPIQQANLWCRELNLKMKFEIKIVRESVAGNLVSAVTIVLTDEKLKKSQTMTMEKFRFKYAAIMEEYEKLSSPDNIGKKIELTPNSAFYVDPNAPQVIGHVKVMLNYLFFNMPIKDTYNIITHTGEMAGQLQLQIKPLFGTLRQKHMARDCETIRDIKNLKSVDLEIKIVKCTGLPVKLASDVRYVFFFYLFVNRVLLYHVVIYYFLFYFPTGAVLLFRTSLVQCYCRIITKF